MIILNICHHSKILYELKMLINNIQEQKYYCEQSQISGNNLINYNKRYEVIYEWI
jgi:hypothetical protein